LTCFTFDGIIKTRNFSGGYAMPTLLIKNARIISPVGSPDLSGDIFIEDGYITLIGQNIPARAETVIDAGGLCALPGLIDMHVHLRDPGQTHKEDILSGCRAAAAGGVTSLACMPNTSPAVDSAEAVKYIIEKAASAKARVYPIAAITPGLRGEKLTDFESLKAAGAVGVSDDGRPVGSSQLMVRAVSEAAQNALSIISHCEILELADGGIMNQGEISKELGVRGIPATAEDIATSREINIAKALNLPVHIAHVSTAGSCEMIRRAKAAGVPVTCETAPHYFWLTEEFLRSRNANFRMNPPLRTEADRQAIIAAVMDGIIDAIATDHAPHTPEEKADFETAPNGIIGLETSLAAAHTALVLSGLISIEKLVELMAAAPAKLLNIPGGVIQPGGIADICLFDPNEKWTVDKTAMQSKAHNTPFDGFAFTGRVKYTVCRGEVVYGL